MKPQRAFAELEHWDEALDGKLDPTRIVEHEGMKGIWRTHGRKGVHIEESYEELGFEETHLEADDSGPLGTERMESRRSLLNTSIADADQSRASVTADGACTGCVDVDQIIGHLA